MIVSVAGQCTFRGGRSREKMVKSGLCESEVVFNWSKFKAR